MQYTSTPELPRWDVTADNRQDVAAYAKQISKSVLVILFTDIVGSTRAKDRLTHDDYQDPRREHDHRPPECGGLRQQPGERPVSKAMRKVRWSPSPTRATHTHEVRRRRPPAHDPGAGQRRHPPRRHAWLASRPACFASTSHIMLSHRRSISRVHRSVRCPETLRRLRLLMVTLVGWCRHHNSTRQPCHAERQRSISRRQRSVGSAREPSSPLAPQGDRWWGGGHGTHQPPAMSC
jgi:hypothetical protein